MKPLTFCKGCGVNIEFYQCVCVEETKYPSEQRTVEISSSADGYPQLTVRGERCELRENCRCKVGDEPGCWNWPE